ncbi:MULTISPECIES: hypothetical protein [Bacillales]|uniref:Phage protein n=1 Tax=Brevibacillus aydinogluensis TaxID=927786 RepID=A0AA48RCP6_9BACL|nr:MULTISPECIES: hypothetical protein [Bacillales]MBR8660356.1 hypothetical protein [Brevibacillus sp. NL20B1]NNV03574.1 hypothetical protein [Brevibacillus sp. MCWH]REK61448.1 MAG: hypothetical protein DF221_16095 [Brevibacillus sp.]MDT3416481.1 hypothetical protein [Brevibacillus aydinogluensis]UFJ60227.1 hypothetical protein IRT44_13115 [Anoxybacillus sediminis]
MKRRVKVTIEDFAPLRENLNNPEELALYEAANGHTYDAEIEHDGYAVIDLPDGDYIELAPGEYQIMIEEWTKAGTIGALTLETKSDPADDKALLYRLVDASGAETEPPRSLSKQVVELLGKTWFGKK